MRTIEQGYCIHAWECCYDQISAKNMEAPPSANSELAPLSYCSAPHFRQHTHITHENTKTLPGRSCSGAQYRPICPAPRLPGGHPAPLLAVLGILHSASFDLIDSKPYIRKAIPIQGASATTPHMTPFMGDPDGPAKILVGSSSTIRRD